MQLVEEEGHATQAKEQAEPAAHPLSQEAGAPPADGRRANP
jgi:hypothetical protein